MRLRWKSELRVGLSPERVVAVRYRRGFGNTIVERSIERFEIPASGPAWASAVQALSRLLEQPSARHSDLFVVLSDHFARYATLPWTPELKGEADWVAYARHSLAATYGRQAAGWELCVPSSGRGKPRIACGIEAELVHAVQNAALEAEVRLQSIRPQLAVVFNRLRATLDRGEAWLAVQESERWTLCVLAGGALQAVRSRRTQGDGLKVLAGMLAREGLFGQLERSAKRVIVYADEPIAQPAEPARAGVRLDDLTLGPREAPELRPFALALA